MKPNFSITATTIVKLSNFYEFETVKPGAIGDGQAPHIAVVIFMRGLLNHVYTRI